MKALLLTLALLGSSTSVLAAPGTYEIMGAKAQALYVALGGSRAAVTSKSPGVISRNIAVIDVDCAPQAEHQSGGPGANSESLKFYMCSATPANAGAESQDYLGENAVQLTKALRHAGVKLFKNTGELATESVSCTKTIESQQGDPGAKPEYLVQYSCEIAKFSPTAYKM